MDLPADFPWEQLSPRRGPTPMPVPIPICTPRPAWGRGWTAWLRSLLLSELPHGYEVERDLSIARPRRPALSGPTAFTLRATGGERCLPSMTSYAHARAIQR